MSFCGLGFVYLTRIWRAGELESWREVGGHRLLSGQDWATLQNTSSNLHDSKNYIKCNIRYPYSKSWAALEPQKSGRSRSTKALFARMTSTGT